MRFLQIKKRFSIFQSGLWLHILVSFVSFLILYSRRPDAVENPQFWAEDMRWYADAYDLTFFETISKPLMGYLQTLSRLIGEVSQFFPLAYAPLIFNVVGFAVEILVVNFLISKRFSKVVPNLAVCLSLGLISLVVPHSSETHINITNSHWHLSVLSFLVIISYSDNKIFWKIFDVVVVAVSAVSGPFAPFLFPIALIIYLKRREKWTLVLSVILAIGSIIQIYFLIQARHPPASQATANSLNLIDLVCGQVFFSGIFGGANFLKFWGFEYKYTLLILLGIISFILITYSFVKSQIELNLFIIYAAGILISAILYNDWMPMAYPLYGERYWLIPITCYLSMLVCIVAKSKNVFIRSLGVILLVLSPIGIYSDWHYKPYHDFQFQQFVQQFEDAPVGTEVQVKINPDWTFTLKKK